MTQTNFMILGLVVSAVMSQSLAGQADSIEIELDLYWAEVSRTVATGDFAGMQATYHPDAIWVSGDAGRLPDFADDGVAQEH